MQVGCSARRALALAVALCGAWMAPAPVASAQSIAATTLGPGRSYDGSTQYLIGGTAISYQFIATSFVYTGPSGLVLDEVRLGLNTSVARTYLVEILHGADLVSATRVATWNLTTTPSFPLWNLFTLVSGADVALSNAETYWIAVSGLGPVGGWSTTDQGIRAPVFVRDVFSATWRSDGMPLAPAYEVTVRQPGTPNVPGVVPEPATVMLTATGLIGTVLLRRRRVPS